MLGTLCLGYGRRAYAQCAPSGPAGTYSCSGSATATQSLSPSPSSAALVVTTTPGFGITTTAGDAFDLSTTASGTGLSFTDANGSMIAGSGYGINAANLGGGDLTITTTGSVSGGVLQTVTASGIQAKNYGAGLTISSAGVIGTNYGISALNEGVGALSITATGAVAGNYNSGIAAKNYGTSLTISAGAVVGGNYGVASGAKGDGVYALNRGSGALSITTSGPVAGAGSGIEARNYGTSLTISAAGAVSGGKFGVYAVNQGSGALSITTTGQVSGGARGIVARNYGTSLSISAAGASGAVVGIGGYNFGSGVLTITATGTASGGTLYGLIGKGYQSGQGVTIQAQNASGGRYGVLGLDYGTGVLSITTTRAVTGSGGAGVFAYSAYGSGVTIKTYGSVTGATHGVYAKLGAYGEATPPVGALSITAAGTVTGTAGAGIYALNFGQAGSTTSITVTSTGLVQGRIAGVFAYSKYGAPIAVTNNGVIQNLSGASTDLAIATSGGPVTIVNNGTITGVVNVSAPAVSAMTNNGTWNVAGGTNAFGGSDILTNAGGGAIVAAASGAASPVTTTFNGLATFNNGLDHDEQRRARQPGGHQRRLCRPERIGRARHATRRGRLPDRSIGDQRQRVGDDPPLHRQCRRNSAA